MIKRSPSGRGIVCYNSKRPRQRMFQSGLECVCLKRYYAIGWKLLRTVPHSAKFQNIKEKLYCTQKDIPYWFYLLGIKILLSKLWKKLTKPKIYHKWIYFIFLKGVHTIFMYFDINTVSL